MSENNQKQPKSHNGLPVWMLGPDDEKQARKNLRKMSNQKCEQQIKAFVECSRQQGVKVFPKCNSLRNEMSECLMPFLNDPKFLDEERDKIVLLKIQKLEKQLQERKG
ncbi:HFL068Cp [Eremothecium sinecaudum]|uniref:COX assembly mitochondrial protein n=1 Tax=Eremothecium sinecaudum TaxID=45286 RepID=A0A0X8HUS9_9SACH|nr:HFL068Cp [Eremothecium sinecaudum]AMD21788.1 HFL068Cp [Eremothecium sinecaudum]